jgi:hypothetical protein
MIVDPLGNVLAGAHLRRRNNLVCRYRFRPEDQVTTTPPPSPGTTAVPPTSATTTPPPRPVMASPRIWVQAMGKSSPYALRSMPLLGTNESDCWAAGAMSCCLGLLELAGNTAADRVRADVRFLGKITELLTMWRLSKAAGLRRHRRPIQLRPPLSGPRQVGPTRTACRPATTRRCSSSAAQRWSTTPRAKRRSSPPSSATSNPKAATPPWPSAESPYGRMLAGIRRVRLTVLRVDAKLKYDDHNPVDHRQRVIGNLEQRGHGLDAGAAGQQRRRLAVMGDWRTRHQTRCVR